MNEVILQIQFQHEVDKVNKKQEIYFEVKVQKLLLKNKKKKKINK